MLGLARYEPTVVDQRGPIYNLSCSHCQSRNIDFGACDKKATGLTISVTCKSCNADSYITILREKSKEKPRSKPKTVGLVLVSHVSSFKLVDKEPT